MGLDAHIVPAGAVIVVSLAKTPMSIELPEWLIF